MRILLPALRVIAAATAALLLSVGARAGACDRQASEPHLVGHPFDTRYAQPAERYARNIWDMRWFDGRLYMGGGNSSNHGPAANAGPVPLMRFDPATGDWRQEATIDDEQIDRFVVLDGELVIPGHDPRQSWKLGNFYRRRPDGAWDKVRTVPEGVHIYDMVSYQGRWFAALGTARGGAVDDSTDRGAHWRTLLVAPSRVYAFLPVGERLYATGVTSAAGTESPGPALWEYREGVFVPRPEWGAARLFPETELPGKGRLRVVAPVRAGKDALYIGGRTHNDHHFLPFGAYRASAAEDGGLAVHRLPVPPGWTPWDIAVREDSVFLLLNRQHDNQSEVAIWQAPIDRAAPWERRAAFSTPGLARSLEVGSDGFYVAVGSEIAGARADPTLAVVPETGAVLRVPFCPARPPREAPR